MIAEFLLTLLSSSLILGVLLDLTDITLFLDLIMMSSVQILLCGVCILPGYPDFLPQPKDMHVRLIADYKLVILVSVSMTDCLSLLAHNRLLSCPECTPPLA